MRAAIHEFTENGFTRAKVEDIAKNAGVSKASIFQYFKDKKELFVYCGEWGVNVFVKKISQRLKISDMDIFDYYQDITAQTEVLREEHELSTFMRVIFNEPGLLNESMKSMYAVGNPYIGKLIRNGKDKGTVRNDIDDEILMEFFSAVTDRFGQRWMQLYITDFPAEPDVDAERAMKNELEHMLRLLKSGMGR